MPIFKFNKAFSAARRVKVFLKSLEDRMMPRNAVPDARRRRVYEQQKRLEQKRLEIRRKEQELLEIGKEVRAAKHQRLETFEQGKRFRDKKREAQSKKREIYRLRNELRALREWAKSSSNGQPILRATGEPETGALPDFVIIGAQRSGTSSFYRLLARHPHVQSAVYKELHYFDNHFEEDIEWYRQCFLSPRWKDGRKTITGEASPSYLFDPPVPRRMAEVIPQARLIVLLRNPVNRAYSHYQKAVRRAREVRSFEEAIEAEEARLRSEGDKMLEAEHYANFDRARAYLARGIYVNQLLRLSKFYSNEQMLVLKSEDFFERPIDTLKVVLDYLDLPAWEPEAREIRNHNKGHYEQEMDPVTRRRLEEFFEPHNQRLYEYLGVDLGW